MSVDVTQPIPHEWTKDPAVALMARLANPSAPNTYERGVPACRHCNRAYSESEALKECPARLRAAINHLVRMLRLSSQSET